MMDGVPWLKVGAHVYVHGINDDYVGEIVAFLPGRMVALKDASWVSESGSYFSTFIATGKAEDMEIEPVGEHVEAFTGITHWPHPLFKERV